MNDEKDKVVVEEKEGKEEKKKEETDKVITEEEVSPEQLEVKEEIKEISGEILALKGVFKVLPQEKVKGILLILAYGETGEMLYSDTITTQYAQVSLPSTTISWPDFEVALSHFKKRYLFDAQFTLPLRNGLLSLEGDLIKDIYQKALRLKEEEIYAIIKERIRKLLPNQEDIDLQLNSEIIPLEEYQKVVEEKVKTKEEEEVVEEAEEKDIYLKVQIAIDPVKGRLVPELNKGERLLVKIVDDSNLAQYLANLLGGKKGEELIPLLASVVRAEEKEMGRFRLIVRFGPGLYGEAIIPPNVKIKIGGEEELEEINPLPPPKIGGWRLKFTPLILGELILLIIFIALIILGKIIP